MHFVPIASQHRTPVRCPLALGNAASSQGRPWVGRAVSDRARPASVPRLGPSRAPGETAVVRCDLSAVHQQRARQLPRRLQGGRCQNAAGGAALPLPTPASRKSVKPRRGGGGDSPRRHTRKALGQVSACRCLGPAEGGGGRGRCTAPAPRLPGRPRPPRPGAEPPPMALGGRQVETVGRA